MRFFAIAMLAASIAFSSLAAGKAEVSHAIAMYGEPKYGKDFTHFDYVNSKAPKGGEVKLAATGSFDSLNFFILKGVAAAGISSISESLTMRSDDEPYTQYGLVAETMEYPKDRSWIIFNMRKEARFHDKTPITADDVVFSFKSLKEKGHPSYAVLYKDIQDAVKLGERRVKFIFSNNKNRELPLIAGQMPILSKKYYAAHEFDKTTLESPLGSGPYKVKSVDPGKSIVYERVKDYWGKDLPVRIGQNNFDTIRYDYYRDEMVAIEAFKAGQYDFRLENIAKVWFTAYKFDALSRGEVKKEEISHSIPTGMQGFVFNTRRAGLADRRVREAISLAFDFEWSNKTMFFNAYNRTGSYFSNSEFASSGLPEGAELALLQGFKDKLPPEVFTTEFKLPKSDGSGNIRQQLLKARNLLEEAGWKIKDGRLTGPSGKAMELELLINMPSFERVMSPFVANLKKLGITGKIRYVDSSQYQKRLDEFDYDIIVHTFPQSLAPGNEQYDYWHSKTADVRGSQNYIGVKDPVVDALVEKIVNAESKEALLAASHALDRVLLWGYYVIPNWHIKTFRVIYWDKFGKPQIQAKYALGFDSWWIKGK